MAVTGLTFPDILKKLCHCNFRIQ